MCHIFETINWRFSQVCPFNHWALAVQMKTSAPPPRPSPQFSSQWETEAQCEKYSTYLIKSFHFSFLFLAFIPDAPEVLSLSADFATSTLHLKWTDKGSAFSYPSKATWEVKVLQHPHMEPIKLVSWDKNPFPYNAQETTQPLKPSRWHPWVWGLLQK